MNPIIGEVNGVQVVYVHKKDLPINLSRDARAVLTLEFNKWNMPIPLTVTVRWVEAVNTKLTTGSWPDWVLVENVMGS